MEPFLGKKYKLKSSEKFDEYLQFIEISFINRKAIGAVSSTCCLKRNDDGSYTFTIETAIRNSVLNFRLNEEFDEERPDGVKVKSVVVLDGNKMTLTQVEANGRKSVHERVFTADSLTTTSTVEGWSDKCVRIFTAI